jgi:hypothetical protein
MGFKMWFFISAERVVLPMQNPLVIIKKSMFFSSLAFFALIISSCAIPACDPGEVKNKAYLKFSRKIVRNDKMGTRSYTSA